MYVQKCNVLSTNAVNFKQPGPAVQLIDSIFIVKQKKKYPSTRQKATFSCFTIISTKGNNFCTFLFVSLDTLALNGAYGV